MADANDFDYESFLNEMKASEHGVKDRGYKPTHTDPVMRARVKYEDNIYVQTEMLRTDKNVKTNKAGNLFGNMFEKMPDGKVVVTLKTGTSPLMLGGVEFVVKANVEEAIAFMEKSVIGAAKGAFDVQFAQNARTESKSKARAKGKALDAPKTNGAARASH